MYGTDKGAIILNNAIDSESFRFRPEIRKSMREEFGISENEVLIGNVGRITSQKNHLFLLEIFASYHAKNSKSKLLLVGDGEDREKIQRKAKELGISGFVILAGVRNDIPRLLQAMDLFVFPSLYEGFPVTVVEAQAAGLPCLISDTITDEVVLMETTLQLPITEGTELWVDAINKFAENKRDRRNVVKTIKEAKYDIEVTSRWLTEFYLRLCE